MDTGRDELLIYDDMLKGEGVETKVDLWPGLPHVFWGLFKQLPQAQRWKEDTLNGFAWLLGE
jgi:acetyl esterase/lipase